jgi:hypothetical protein
MDSALLLNEILLPSKGLQPRFKRGVVPHRRHFVCPSNPVADTRNGGTMEGKFESKREIPTLCSGG